MITSILINLCSEDSWDDRISVSACLLVCEQLPGYNNSTVSTRLCPHACAQTHLWPCTSTDTIIMPIHDCAQTIEPTQDYFRKNTASDS